MISNLNSMVDKFSRQKEEESKTYVQIKREKEINEMINDLSMDLDNSKEGQQIILENIGCPDLKELDKSLIERLNELKDLSLLGEDEKLRKALGITEEDLKKRKDLEEDKLSAVLYPDGVTAEEKETFEADTDNFLNYLYGKFIIKTVVVPGTEIVDLFTDTIQID